MRAAGQTRGQSIPRSVKLLEVAGWLLRVATSRRTTLLLVTLLLGAIALQAVIPQQGWVSPMNLALWRARYPVVGGVVQTLGLDHIVAKPWFWALGISFVAALSITTTRRALRLARGWVPPQRGRQTTDVWAGADMETASGALRRHGYSVSQTSAGLVAEKGRAGRWGSVAFHIGVAILIVGVFLSALTRFAGFVEMAPGQTFQEDAEAYMASGSGPFGRDTTGISLHVRDIDLAFWPDNTVKNIRASVTAWDRSGRQVERTIGRNEAFSGVGSTILLGSRFGPAALLRFTPLGGGETQQGYVNFAADSGVALNRFTIPGDPNLAAEVRLEGNWRATLANPSSDAPLTLQLVFWRGGEIVEQSSLASGESVTLHAGDLAFAGIEPWAMFMVGRDAGFWILLIGGAIALIGLALALFIAPRWVQVLPAAEGLRVVGSTTHPAASFRRELAVIGKRLRRTEDV